MFSDSYNVLLPIKPKPLLYPKDSTLLSDSRYNSKTDQNTADVTIVSSFVPVVLFEKRESFSQHEIE